MGINFLFAIIAAVLLFLYLAWDDMGNLLRGKPMDNNGLALIIFIIITTLSIVLLIVFGVE